MDTAYVREKITPKIAGYKAQYLHFRYLKCLVKNPLDVLDFGFPTDKSCDAAPKLAIILSMAEASLPRKAAYCWWVVIYPP